MERPEVFVLISELDLPFRRDNIAALDSASVKGWRKTMILLHDCEQLCEGCRRLEKSATPQMQNGMKKHGWLNEKNRITVADKVNSYNRRRKGREEQARNSAAACYCSIAVGLISCIPGFQRSR